MNLGVRNGGYIMKKLAIAAVAASIAIMGGTAQAGTVHIEDFGTTKPSNPYENGGYVWDPVSATQGQCYDAWCIKEAGTQDLLTTVDTYPDDSLKFDLLGFYVNLDGNGSVEGEGDDAKENFLEITSDIGTDDLILGLNTSYFADATVSIYEEVSLDPVDFLEKKSDGFWVIIEEGFTGVDELFFTALGSANVRIDCMALGQGDYQFGGLDELSSCVPSSPPPPNEIPVPAAGWLLLAGLGGLAAMRKRRS